MFQKWNAERPTRARGSFGNVQHVGRAVYGPGRGAVLREDADPLHRIAMPWTFSRKSPRRLTPAGFIQPALPTLVDNPPRGAKWIHEIKHDGYRLIARKEHDAVRLWSRYGTDFTDSMRSIATSVANLPAKSATIDGEAVVLRGDGHSDFEALRTRTGAACAIYVVFDLLHLDGRDLRQRPLEERRALLADLVANTEGILFSEAIAAEGDVVFDAACRMGLEGIVSKRLGSPYQSGRTRFWLKTKNPKFIRPVAQPSSFGTRASTASFASRPVSQ